MLQMQSEIEAIENNSLLYEEKNFDQRIEAIDFIEFPIVDHIEELLAKTDQPAQLLLLKQHAEKVKSELEEVNISLLRKLQKNISTGEYMGKRFKNLVNEYVDFNIDDTKHQEEPGFDSLDVFINGLLSFQAMPGQTKDLEPEMVFYQKTPARIIFELVEKIKFAKEDVFFDLGSGLGQVGILMNLLTGVTAKGVEFEPAFCDYSRDCVAKLNLSNITFINTDARQADYSDGTVFFMYTPFHGEILREVLEILRKESLLRKIRLITYGPCTPKVASQSWLDSTGPKDDNIYKLNVFASLQN